MPSDRVNRQIDRLLDQMEKALERRDWVRVRDLAMDALSIDPDNENAQLFLAAANRSLENINPDSRVEVAQAERVLSSSSAVQPASFVDGRYIVVRLLGKGGKKVVYLAHDELLDRDVAFALIEIEGSDEVARARISREAQIMGRLGSHPNIVTVFDKGEYEGHLYMVTELMEGGDVEGLVEDAQDKNLPLARALSIVVDTCKGLEFAHSKGIVHRDLKPGNVWLAADGAAKIGDFGLAVAMDNSRITQKGTMVGTVDYMPPEQALGGEVTPKSDLYSLGAMLYEMVTGRPPFLGDDNVAIIGQHINTPPVAPTWYRSECPMRLEAIIMKLLSKNPDERPANATEVRSALEALDLSATSESRENFVEQDYILDSLAGGVFVGRQAEMERLKAALEDAISSNGRIVTLAGEPGSGKTRTAQELATYARLRGCQVIWGRCYNQDGAPVYWPWVQALRSYVHNAEAAQLRSEMGQGASVIAELIPEVKKLLVDLGPPVGLDNPEEERFRLFDSICSFLKTAAQRQPSLVVIDDLQWSDKSSLMLLQFIAREISTSRLIIVATYRPSALNRQHPLSDTLGEIAREIPLERVLLRGLSQNDVKRFIEIVSGTLPPHGLVSAVQTRTEGNPLFITEVVRLLKQEGRLTEHDAFGRESWTFRIPEGIREAIGLRLNLLSKQCNEALTVASIIGREFTFQQLELLVDNVEQDTLLNALEDALRARIIEELPSTVGLYQFTHPLVQETLSEELALIRRTPLHARIAEMFEELYANDINTHAIELAFHFHQAEALLGSEKVIRYSLMAGNQALATYAYEVAVTHFGNALVSKGDQIVDAELTDILFGLGRSKAATAGGSEEYEEAWNTIKRAFECCLELKDAARAIEIAKYPQAQIGIQEVVSVVARAIDLAPSDSLEAGQLLSRYGYAKYFETGDYEGAQQAISEALAIAQQREDICLEAQSLAYSGSIEFFHQHFQASLESNLRVIELAQPKCPPQSTLRARNWASYALLSIGDSESAHVNATAMLNVAEMLRDRVWTSYALLLNANLARLKGDWQAAREFIDRGLVLSPNYAGLVGIKALLHYDIGEIQEGNESIRRFMESKPFSGPGTRYDSAFLAVTLPMLRRIPAAINLIQSVEQAVETIRSLPSYLPFDDMYSTIGKGLMAVEQRNVSVIREQYMKLGSVHGMMEQMWGVISLDRLLGTFARSIEAVDDAIIHFLDAQTFCRKAGYQPELAWSLHDHAVTLLERNKDGDQEEAIESLDESLNIATKLNMSPLMEHVLSKREILKA